MDAKVTSSISFTHDIKLHAPDWNNYGRPTGEKEYS
jgi:hypothetical protein